MPISNWAHVKALVEYQVIHLLPSFNFLCFLFYFLFIFLMLASVSGFFFFFKSNFLTLSDGGPGLIYKIGFLFYTLYIGYVLDDLSFRNKNLSLLAEGVSLFS